MKNIASLLSIFLFLGLISCKGNSEEEAKVFNALEQGFENSNEVIGNSNTFIYRKLENDSKDPVTMYKGQIWNAKANIIKTYCDSTISYLNKIKKEIPINKFDRKNILELFDKLKSLKSSVVYLDPDINAEFEKSLFVNNISNEKVEDSSNIFLDCFLNKSIAQQLCLLSKIKNNIKISENKIITFCSFKYTTHDISIDKLSCLYSQNAEILKGGNELIITAGVGAFSSNAVPKIVITNKFVEAINGVATYKMKTPLKAGKYKLPITISSIDQSGNKHNETRSIEYEVSELK